MTKVKILDDTKMSKNFETHINNVVENTESKGYELHDVKISEHGLPGKKGMESYSHRSVVLIFKENNS